MNLIGVPENRVEDIFKLSKLFLEYPDIQILELETLVLSLLLQDLREVCFCIYGTLLTKTLKKNLEQVISDSIVIINSFFHRRQVWVRFVYPVVLDLLRKTIISFISMTEDELQFIPSLKELNEEIILPLEDWVKSIAGTPELLSDIISYCRKVLCEIYFRNNYKSFTKALHGKLKDIFLLELKVISEFVDISPLLVQHFHLDIYPNLLNVGVCTSIILDNCFLYIMSLNSNNRTKKIANFLVQPIISYLKTRKDLMKFLVAKIIGQSSPIDLGQVFKKILAKSDKDEDDFEKEVSGDKSSDGLEENLETDLQVDDVIRSFLFSVGCLTEFMSNFEESLQKNLLKCHQDQNLSSDVNLIENLKEVFGKDMTANSSVMVADVLQSKTIFETLSEGYSDFECLILSSSCWPMLKNGNYEEEHIIIKNISEIEKFQEEAQKIYKNYRSMRSVIWTPDLDVVELEFKYSDGKVKLVECNGIDANVFMLFIENVKLSASMILKILQIKDMEHVQEALKFWMHLEVIKKIPDSMYTFF